MSSPVRQKEFGSDHGLIHEAVVTGRKVGAGEDFWKALGDDEALFRRVVRLVQGDEVPSGNVTPEEAAQIMGSNFHPVAAAAAAFGFRPSAKHKRELLNVPFGREILSTCQRTHILVPGLPLSITDIHKLAAREFYSQADPWYGQAEQKFGRDKIKLGWYLVRKDAVPNSTSRTWNEQQGLVPEGEFVPEANLAVYAAILHKLQTGERLFSRVWVRTNSGTAHGGPGGVGFRSDGLFVGSWDDDAYSSIGVASARKSS